MKEKISFITFQKGLFVEDFTPHVNILCFNNSRKQFVFNEPIQIKLTAQTETFVSRRVGKLRLMNKDWIKLYKWILIINRQLKLI